MNRLVSAFAGRRALLVAPQRRFVSHVFDCALLHSYSCPWHRYASSTAASSEGKAFDETRLGTAVIWGSVAFGLMAFNHWALQTKAMVRIAEDSSFTFSISAASSRASLMHD